MKKLKTIPKALLPAGRALWPVRHAQTRLPVGKHHFCLCVGIAAYLFGFPKCPLAKQMCCNCDSQYARVRATKSVGEKLKIVL
jgi:hypothetical protein